MLLFLVHIYSNKSVNEYRMSLYHTNVFYISVDTKSSAKVKPNTIIELVDNSLIKMLQLAQRV
jgi:hypothetical protein